MTDITGDGRADVVVTSPWGLGVLGLDGGTFRQHAIASNGTRLGQWLLNTKDNNVELLADLDGDGRREALMSSPWGVGVLKHTGTGLTSVAMAANGTRLGGWIISTADNQLLHAADVDGDGRDEVLVTSPWGLGILELGPTGLTSLMLAPNGTRFGGWLLNTGDNAFPLLADVDGDGRAEIVVTSPWGLGILELSGTTLTSIVMAPNGTSFGDWTLDTATDRIEVAADVDGDGADELVISGPTKAGVLKVRAGALVTIATAGTGSDLGGWTLDAVRDRLGVAGDLDGDGADELLVTGDSGLAVLEYSGGTLRAAFAARNGTRLGEWLLNTRDNRLNRVADLNGDGRAEILATSPWGIGVLRLDGGRLTSVAMAPNGSRFGGWLLNTADNDLEAGHGQSYAVLVTHPQWDGAVADTARVLRARGFTVLQTADGNVGITLLRRLARTVRPGDRVFVYLAGHGGSNRPALDRSRETALLHILQFGDGAIVWYRDFAPSFELMGDKGADLVVFNGACDGGESVLHATGERFLALSTTSVHAPGITGTPDPSDVMAIFGKPSHFGLWWSRDNGASLLNATVPHRFFQKIYRSDDTEIARLSLFHKPALDFLLNVGRSWELMVFRCYLLRHIYPDVYAGLTAAEKAATTVDVETYLTTMRASYDTSQTAIADLRRILGDSALVARAADVYAGAYPRPWQSLFGDMSWDVNAEPVRESPIHTPIQPNLYAGRDGFIRMVAEVLRLIRLLETSYATQESLLRRIDRAVRRRILDLVLTDRIELRPPLITDYLRFNEFERRDTAEQVRLLDLVPETRLALTRAVEVADGLDVDLSAVDRLDEEPDGPDDGIDGIGTIDRLGKVRDLPGVDGAPGLRVAVRRDLRPDAADRALRVREGAIVLERAVDTEIDRIRIEALEHLLVDESVADLVARLAAVRAAGSVHLDQLFYTLTIVEEAISRVQATGAETGELLHF